MASAFRHRAGILIRALIYVPLWLLGLLLLVLGLALSPWGTSWLVSQGESRGWLSVESVEGAPLDTLVLRGLHVETDTLELSADLLRLNWADDCLLHGRLCLDALQLRGARIRLEQGESADDPAPDASDSQQGMPSIDLPFPIELRALALEDVSVHLPDGTRLSWARFTSGLRASGHRVTLLPTRWEEIRLALPQSAGQTLALQPLEAASRLTAEAIDAANAVHESPQAVDEPLSSDVNVAAAKQVVPQTPAEDIADAIPPVTAQTPDGKEEAPRLALPDVELPMDVHVPRLIVDDFRLQGPTPYQVDQLRLSASAQDSEVSIDQLHVETPDGSARLKSQVRLQDEYPLEAHLVADIHREPLTDQHVVLDAAGSLASLVLTLQAEGDVTARLNAELDALAPALPFSVELQAEDLHWPLTPPATGGPLGSDDGIHAPAIAASRQLAQSSQPAYRLDTLTLQASGSLDEYHVALSAAGEGDGIPPAQLALTGRGDLEHFAWQPLTLETRQGSLRSEGEIHWVPNLAVEGQINLNRLPLNLFTDAVDGRLNGQARLNFNMTDEGWYLDLPELSVDGTLQDRPLNLEARLQGDSDMHWQVERLELRQGRNRLQAQGRIGETLALHGSVEAPALSTLLPELGGALNGEFEAGGTLEAPQLDIELQGSALQYADNRVGSLSLEAQTAGLEDPRLNLDLDVRDIVAADNRISSLNAELDGRLSQHRLTIQTDLGEELPASRAQLSLEGGLNQRTQRYEGRFTQLMAKTDYGQVHLEDGLPFSADLAASRLEAQPFCLVREEGGRICSREALQASAQQGNAAFILREIPLSLLNESLPPQWKIAGDLDGQTAVRWSGGGAEWSADASLEGEFGITGEDASGQPWQVPQASLALQAQATPRQASTEMTLDLEEAGRLALDLDIDDPTGRRALDGRMTLDDLQLAPYRALAGDLRRLEGALNGDVAIEGTLEAPRLNGDLLLENVQVQGTDIPVTIADARLAVALEGTSARIDGFVAGDNGGRLNLEGTAAWPEPAEWQVSLQVNGVESPLLVTLPQFGRLRVAPDLQIDADPDLLRVRGQVRVPWARIEVSQVPESAVAPSSDEVIITRREDARMAAENLTEEQSEAAAQALAEAGMALDVRIELILGDDVTLAAFGLETDLTGNLEIHQSTGPVQLFGDINLENGRYSAFGQDLVIRQGQVLFSGPASQPRLQFEAIRNPDTTEDDVTAGLRVTGPASQPSLEIFSEPAMDESRALSYLLRGRAPESSGDDNALASALIGLSLSRSGRVVGQIGQAFGVEDLSLDTAGSGDESQVVVSGYVFDDLKVSYGVGVFSPIAELTLRYRLLQDLYVEVVSGAAQAVDLIYTFSRGRSSASP
ncbi:translocation/assembly module TamB domain-containing protein [Halomonas shantousis]